MPVAAPLPGIPTEGFLYYVNDGARAALLLLPVPAVS